MLLFVVLLGAARLSAQPSSDVERLAVGLARVCVNEAGFDSPADCALIWQATRRNGSTHAARLRWLSRHSGRVLGSRPCAGGNCTWTRYLGARPLEPRLVERWRRVLGLCRQLVSGAPFDAPCPTDPDTWDGRRWLARAVARGYVPVGCVGTRNEGFLRPRRARVRSGV